MQAPLTNPTPPRCRGRKVAGEITSAKKILTEAAAVRDATARAIAFHWRQKGVFLSQQQPAASVRLRLQISVAARRVKPRRLQLYHFLATVRYTHVGYEQTRETGEALSRAFE